MWKLPVAISQHKWTHLWVYRLLPFYAKVCLADRCGLTGRTRMSPNEGHNNNNNGLDLYGAFQVTQSAWQGSRFHSFTLANYDSSHSCPRADWRKRGCHSAPTAPPTTTSNIQQSYTFTQQVTATNSRVCCSSVLMSWINQLWPWRSAALSVYEMTSAYLDWGKKGNPKSHHGRAILTVNQCFSTWPWCVWCIVCYYLAHHFCVLVHVPRADL